MAIALDAVTNSTEGGVGDWEFIHTPTGTPGGILLLASSHIATDISDVVAYGGVAMTEVPGSPVIYSGAEPFILYAYFLGASIPTGPQNVTISKNGAGTTDTRYTCISLTAGADTQINDVQTGSGDATPPTLTLSLGGASSFAALVWGHGSNDVLTGVSPLTGWTDQFEVDIGTRGMGAYTYDTIGTANVSASISAASDDYAMLAVAIKESAAAGHNVTIANATSTPSVSGAAVGQTHLVGTANATSQPVASGAAVQLTHQATIANAASQPAVSGAAVQLTHQVAAANATSQPAASGAAVTQDTTHLVSAASATSQPAASGAAIQQTHLITMPGVAIDSIASGSAVVQAHLVGAASASSQPAASGASVTDGMVEVTVLAARGKYNNTQTEVRSNTSAATRNNTQTARRFAA